MGGAANWGRGGNPLSLVLSLDGEGGRTAGARRPPKSGSPRSCRDLDGPDAVEGWLWGVDVEGEDVVPFGVGGDGGFDAVGEVAGSA